MTGTRTDMGESIAGVGEQRQQRDQAGTNDEGLGDRGVADGVRIRGGAVGEEVDAADARQPLQPLTNAGDVQPGGQKAGGLRTLAGGDDDEHVVAFLPWSASAGMPLERPCAAYKSGAVLPAGNPRVSPDHEGP